MARFRASASIIIPLILGINQATDIARINVLQSVVIALGDAEWTNIFSD